MWRVNTWTQKWCIKELHFQFLTSDQMAILRVKSSLRSWPERLRIRKFLHHQITSKWDSCLTRSSKLYEVVRIKIKCLCPMMNKISSSLRILDLKRETMQFKRKTKAIKIICNSKKNKICNKMPKMMRSLTLDAPRWTSSRREQEKS